MNHRVAILGGSGFIGPRGGAYSIQPADEAMYRAESLYRFLDRACGEIGVDHTTSDSHHAPGGQGLHCGL